MDLDPAAIVGLATRSLSDTVRDGAPAKLLVASRTYDTDLPDLWDALTDPSRIPRWFLPVSGDLRSGGRFALEGNAEGDIVACEPPRRLELTWEHGGQTSWVTVTLEPVDERARLELRHEAHVPAELWQEYGPGATGVGWDGALMGLGLHIASGEAVDPDEVLEWSTSEQGRAFHRAASEAWADAAVDAGMPEAEARAAADRTLAFYSPPAE